MKSSNKEVHDVVGTLARTETHVKLIVSYGLKLAGDFTSQVLVSGRPPQALDCPFVQHRIVLWPGKVLSIQ